MLSLIQAQKSKRSHDQELIFLFNSAPRFLKGIIIFKIKRNHHHLNNNQVVGNIGLYIFSPHIHVHKQNSTIEPLKRY